MAQWTRYLTVILAVIQATAYSIGFFNQAIIDKSPIAIITVIIVLTAGTAFLMWLGELITDRGIGNGISLIIMTGIVSRIPSDIGNMIYSVQTGTANIIEVLIFLVFAFFIIVGVIAIQQVKEKFQYNMQKELLEERCTVDKAHIFL